MKLLSIVTIVVMITSAYAEESAIKIATDLIASNEGFSETVYQCSAGKDTIGYGFTSSDIISKGTISVEEADKILTEYTTSCMVIVDDNVTVKLTNNQKAALCDFIYHFGKKAFLDSTLLKYINEGKSTDEICQQLGRWKYAKINGEKVVVQGLVNRCNKLIELYKGE